MTYGRPNITLINDGCARDLTVGASGHGNGIDLWDAVNSVWKPFKVPVSVAITNVSNNGSGGVRVTHATTPRNFVTGQWVTVRGITGVTTNPYNINVDSSPSSAGSRRITVIDANNFDIDGFTFASGTYTGGGVIDPVVAAHVNDITIDGVAHQTLPSTLVSYLVGLRYLDAACTVGEIVLDSVREGPGADYVNLNKDSDTGINLLPSYTNVPLIGMVVRDAALHVQGNANCILVVDWNHPELLNIVTSYTGNTGGVLNTYVPLSTVTNGRLAWQTWRGKNQSVDGLAHVSSTAAADITIRLKHSRPGAAGISKEFTIRHDGNGIKQIAMNMRLPADTHYDGVWFLDAEMKTTAGTATLDTTGSWLSGRSTDVRVTTQY